MVHGSAHLIFPVLEAVLLAALIIGDPGRIDRRSRTLQRLAIALVLVLVAGALAQTVRLSIELINNDPPAIAAHAAGGRRRASGS